MQYGNKLFAGKEQYKGTVDLKQCVQITSRTMMVDATAASQQPAICGAAKVRSARARCCEKPKVLFACATT